MTREVPHPELISGYTRFREPSEEDLLAWDRALMLAAEELGCLPGEKLDVVKVALPYGGVRTAYELAREREREEGE